MITPVFVDAWQVSERRFGEDQSVDNGSLSEWLMPGRMIDQVRQFSKVGFGDPVLFDPFEPTETVTREISSQRVQLANGCSLNMLPNLCGSESALCAAIAIEWIRNNGWYSSDLMILGYLAELMPDEAKYLAISGTLDALNGSILTLAGCGAKRENRVQIKRDKSFQRKSDAKLVGVQESAAPFQSEVARAKHRDLEGYPIFLARLDTLIDAFRHTAPDLLSVAESLVARKKLTGLEPVSDLEDWGASLDDVLFRSDAKIKWVHSGTNNVNFAKQKQHVLKPWGSYSVLDFGTGFLAKKIVVLPGGCLSLQYHEHRCEHWIVVQGTAAVTIEDQTYDLQRDQAAYIPKLGVHRIENRSREALVLIEVQTGEQLHEMDIVRLEDKYGRAENIG